MKNIPSQGKDMKSGVYGTDPEFMAVVKRKYVVIGDLAADEANAKHKFFLTEEEDSLSVEWNVFYEFCKTEAGCGGYLWLNPPYDDIGAWARKCAEASVRGAKILFLVPAAVGSNWYRKYVEEFARVDLLNGRLVFDFLYPEDYCDKDGKPSKKAGKRNTDCYPKDMILCEYNRDIEIKNRVAKTWNWRASL